LILCTPISIWGFSSLTKPQIELIRTGYNPKNGIAIKSETWRYDDSEFKKDST